MRRIDRLVALALCAALSACTPGADKATATDTAGSNPVTAPPSTPATPGPETAPVEEDQAASRNAARQVVMDYYAAIDSGDYRKAYSAWGDDGAASGQTYQLFSGGYANTESVRADVGEPGEVEGAAGSRYTTVPVELHARQKDGSERGYRGRFTLRRTVVDGASEAQRRWHLDSAEMQRIGGP